MKIGQQVHILTRLMDGDKVTGFLLEEAQVVSFDGETACLVQSSWSADRIRFRKVREVHDTFEQARLARLVLEAELKENEKCFN